MTTTHVEIEPTKRTAHRQYYRVRCAGEVLVENSWNPEFDACRVLHERGVTGMLVTRLVGMTHAALQLDIAKAAGLTVIEVDRLGPRFAKWTEFGATEAEHAFAVHAGHRRRQGDDALASGGLEG